jgi:hypothetical protein
MAEQPPKRRRVWLRRAAWIAAALLLLAALGFAIVARRHALAFLEFTEHGALPRPPDQLSTGEKLDLLLDGIALPKPANHSTPADVGLSFETREIVTDDGAVLSVWFVPVEQPVGTAVLFHGYTQSKDELLAAAAELVALGYACWLVDFRGSGDSSEAYTTIGWLEAEDVRAVVSQIDRCGPLVLYGVSMGAAAILRAVGQLEVEADALILDAPFDRMLSAVENRFALVGLPAFPAAQVMVFFGGLRFGFDAFAHQPVAYAAEVETPVLVLHGGDDHYALADEVDEITDALRGPKQLERFAGVGHQQIVEVRPSEWRVLVVAFLAEHAPASAGAVCR